MRSPREASWRRPRGLAAALLVAALAAPAIWPGPADARTYTRNLFSDGSAVAEVVFPQGGGWNNSTSITLPSGAEILEASLDMDPLPGEERGFIGLNASALASTAGMESLEETGGVLTLDDEGWWWSRGLGTCSTDAGTNGTVLGEDGARLAQAPIGLWSPEAPAPVARFDASAAWDDRDCRMIVLGGWSWVARFNSVVDFFYPKNGTWTQKPAGIPQRSDHTAVWDGPRGRMLVFGGLLSNNSVTQEMWAYYPLNNSWVMEPSGPPARAGHSAVIASGRMLVFGGYQPGRILDELWSFDLQNDSWSLVGNGSVPALSNHTAVFDPVRGDMIIFGGVAANDTASCATWIYDAGSGTWRCRPSSPPGARQMHTAVWDSLNGQMLIFGGLNGNTSAGSSQDDLWAYDPSSGDWTRLMSGASPRSRHCAVWDQAGGRMLMSGGWAWFYNGSDCWSYKLMNRAAGTVTSAPLAVGGDPNATVWLDVDQPAGTSCLLDILSGTQTPETLVKGLRNGDTVTIPPGYQSIRLRARLETHDANLTPVLKGWGIGTRVASAFDGTGTSYWTEAAGPMSLLPQGSESWTLLSKGPSARYGHSAVWDSDNGQMLVYGGAIGQLPGNYSNELWAYLPSENTWYRKSWGPGGRMYHSACWDPDDRLMLVYGGFNGGRLNDMWAYSTTTDKWSYLGYAPSARERHCAVWDPDEHVMLVFGGSTGGGSAQYSRDLLEYRPADNKWTFKATVNNGRNHASAVWDGVLHRMLVFGGVGTGGLLMSDLWSYFPANDSWQSTETPVRARFAHSAAYNSSSEEMVVFGGNDSRPSGTLVAYSCRSGNWTMRASGTVAAEYASAVWDSQTGRLLVFGGCGAGPLDELWSYHVSERNWTRKAEAPMAAYGYSAVWDPQESIMLVYGGSPINGRSDIWTYSPSAGRWSRSNATGPLPRFFHCAAWDGSRGRMLMFGGSDNIKCLDDFWAYYPSGDRWLRLAGGPPARMGAVAAWNPAKDELILIGGQGSDPQNATMGDVWVYLAGYDQWVRKADAPARLGWAASAWDGAREIVYLFGGSTVSGGNETVCGELWAFSWTDNLWTDLGTGASPRKGASAAWDQPNGRILLFGGECNGTFQPGLWSYSPAERSWRWRPGGPGAVSQGAAIWEPVDSQFMIFGGHNGSSVSKDLWSFGPVYATGGAFVSRVHDLGCPASLGPASWTAHIPPLCSVSLSIRTSPDGTAWSTWQALAPAGVRPASAADRFVQWRAELGSPQNTSTPLLEEFCIDYTRFVSAGWLMCRDIPVPGPLRRMSAAIDRSRDDGGLSVLASTDGGSNWTPVSGDVPVNLSGRADRFCLKVEFERLAGGASPALEAVSLDYYFESLPEDIELRMGNVSIPLGDLRQRARVDIAGALASLLSGEVGRGDTVSAPLCIHSASAAGLSLSGLDVVFGHNRPPQAVLLEPAGGSSLHKTTVRLSWEATDADGDQLSFFVFLSPTPLVAGASPVLATCSTSCEISGIVFNTEYQWTVVPNDGALNGSRPPVRTFSTVNRPPGIISEPPVQDILVGRELVYCVTAQDDDGDFLTFVLESGPEGMAIDRSTGVLVWSPGNDQTGSSQATVAVSDGLGGEARQQFSVHVTGPSSPFCRILSPSENARAGRHMDVSGTAGPVGGRIVAVQVRVDGDSWQAARGTDDWKCTLDTGGLAPGMHILEARAYDGELYSSSTTVQIWVVSPAQSSAASFFWVLPLLVMVTGCGLAAAIYIRGRRGPAEAFPDDDAPALRAGATAMNAISAKKAGMPAANRGAAASAEAPVMVPQRDIFLVEDMFLMYRDGRLIQHNTRRLKADLDLEVMTSMLRAVQIFVRESLGMTDRSELGAMEYGDNKIILQKGRHVILAVVVSGDAPSDFREEMKGVINDIEGEYEPVLAEWNGVASDVAGAHRFLNRLGFQRTWESPVIRPKAVVAVSSELEFYQGFVRVKVSIKNSMPTVVRNTSLRMIFNEKVLRLDRIEPDYQLDGHEIMMGDIEPREKRTVALLLDPQICTESYLEGLFVFKDAQGQLDAVKMPRKLVSVVCPIMFTEQNVNVAMLKRMVMDELDKKDAKVFSLPPQVSADDAFRLGKAAVEHHDMKLVRELINREPFLAEAWYYGVVKGRENRDRLVTRVRVLGDKKVLEFHVACSSTLLLTGMLAELKSDLNRELDETKLEAMRQVTSAEEVSAVSKIRSLLDKMAEGERSAGETDQESHELLKP